MFTTVGHISRKANMQTDNYRMRSVRSSEFEMERSGPSRPYRRQTRWRPDTRPTRRHTPNPGHNGDTRVDRRGDWRGYRGRSMRGGHRGQIIQRPRERGYPPRRHQPRDRAGNSQGRDDLVTPAKKGRPRVCRTSILDRDRDSITQLLNVNVSQVKVFVVGHDYVLNFFNYANQQARQEYKSLEQWLMVEQLVGKVYYHGVAGAMAFQANELLPVARLSQIRPDIVLMDIGTNDVDSDTEAHVILNDIIDLAKKIKAEVKPWVVVMCSIVENRALLQHVTKEEYQEKAKYINNQLNRLSYGLRGIEFFRHKVNCNRKLDEWNSDGIHPDVTLGMELYKRTMKQAMLGARTEVRCAQMEARQMITDDQRLRPPIPESLASAVSPPQNNFPVQIPVRNQTPVQTDIVSYPSSHLPPPYSSMTLNRSPISNGANDDGCGEGLHIDNGGIGMMNLKNNFNQDIEEFEKYLQQQRYMRTRHRSDRDTF